MLSFIIPGQPVAKARPRFTKNGHAYTPKKTEQYEARVAAIAHQCMNGDELLAGAVQLNIDAYFEIPGSWPKWKQEMARQNMLWHTTKPDRDNVEKSIKDGLNGVVWRDDSQVVEGRVRKLYSHTPRVSVRVQPLPGAHAGMKTLKDLEAV